MSEENQNEEIKPEADIDMTQDENCPDGVCPDDQVCPDGEDCCDGCDCFPAEVPFDCIKSMVEIVRSGELAERKLELLRHGAWAVGCLSALAEGMVGANDDCPDGVCPPEVSEQIKSSREDAIALTPQGIAEEIERICDGEDCGDGKVGSGAGFLSPELIGLILQLIQLIAKR